MNNLWSFESIKNRLGRFQFLMILIVAFAATFYAGFRLSGQIVIWQKEQLNTQQDRLAGLYQELDQKIRQINYLSVEFEVEQNAAQQMKQELLGIKEESLQLRTELNFYQKVLAPELVADGLAIEQFDISASNRLNQYKFKFALVQTDTRKRNAKGYIKLNLVGIENGQTRTLDLAKLSDLQSESLRFSFHYFQYFEGEFELKDGFIPEDIEIKVVQPKTKWQPYKAFTEKLEWPELSSS
jgi:hypothetical protein